MVDNYLPMKTAGDVAAGVGDIQTGPRNSGYGVSNASITTLSPLPDHDVPEEEEDNMESDLTGLPGNMMDNATLDVTRFLRWNEVKCKIDTRPLLGEDPDNVFELGLSCNVSLDSISNHVHTKVKEAGVKLKSFKIFGVENCSEAGMLNPSWKQLNSNSDLHHAVKTWLISVQGHKTKMFIAKLQRLTKPLVAVWKRDRIKKPLSESEEETYAMVCHEVWRMLMSVQSHALHNMPQLFDLIVQPLSDETAFNLFTDIHTSSLQEGILGVLWAATSHKSLREKLVRETDVVNKLMELVKVTATRPNMRIRCPVLDLLLGALSGLVCNDGYVVRDLTSGCFVNYIDTLMMIVTRCHEYGNQEVLEASARLLCHLLLNDFAMQQPFIYSSKFLADLVGTIEVKEKPEGVQRTSTNINRFPAPSVLMCVTTVMLNLTRKRGWCEVFLQFGHLKQLVMLVGSIREALSDRTLLRTIQERMGSVADSSWRGYAGDGCSAQIYQLSVNRMLLESLLRVISVLWACIQKLKGGDKPHNSDRHHCASYYSGTCNISRSHSTSDSVATSALQQAQRAALVGNPSLNLIDDQEDGDHVHKLYALKLTSEELTLIFNVCIGVCKTTFTMALNPFPSMQQVMGHTQAAALCCLEALLHFRAEVHHVLEDSKKMSFCSDIARALSSRPYDCNTEAPLLRFGANQEYSVNGSLAISAAFNVASSMFLEYHRCQSTFLFCKRRTQRVGAANFSLCKSYVTFLANAARFGKQLAIDQIGLQTMAQHVYQDAEQHKLSGGESLHKLDNNTIENEEEADEETKVPSRLRLLAKLLIREQRVSSFLSEAHESDKTGIAAWAHSLAGTAKKWPSISSSAPFLTPTMSLRLRFGIFPQPRETEEGKNAKNLAHQFLSGIKNYSFSRDQCKVVAKMQTLTSAVAFARGPQTQQTLALVHELAVVVPLRSEAYLAMWFFARDETNRRTLGDLGVMKTILGDLKSAVLDQSAETVHDASVGSKIGTTRALELLWLLCYDNQNLGLLLAEGGVKKVTELLEKLALNSPRAGFVCVQILRVCAGNSTVINPSYEIDADGADAMPAAASSETNEEVAQKGSEHTAEIIPESPSSKEDKQEEEGHMKNMAEALARSKALIIAWRCAAADTADPRLRCAASSLIMMLPMPAQAAEKSAVALIKMCLGVALEENDEDTAGDHYSYRSRGQQHSHRNCNHHPPHHGDGQGQQRKRDLVIYGGNMCAHIQFSPRGHELLRKTNVVKMLMIVAIEACNRLAHKDDLHRCVEHHVADKPRSTGLINSHCITCRDRAELSAALIGVLNVASDRKTQVILCHNGLTHFLQMAWSIRNEEHQKLLRAVLTKLASNPANRLQIYDLELRARTALCFGTVQHEANKRPATSNRSGSTETGLHGSKRNMRIMSSTSSNSSGLIDRYDKNGSHGSQDMSFLLPDEASGGDERQAFLDWFQILHDKVDGDNKVNQDGDVLPTSYTNIGDMLNHVDTAGIRVKTSVSISPASSCKGLAAITTETNDRKTPKQFWQAVREPRDKLWTNKNRNSTAATGSNNREIPHWNIDVERVTVTPGKSRAVVLKLGDEFPHSTFTFQGGKAVCSGGGNSTTTSKSLMLPGACDIALFPHVQGSRVYENLGMHSHDVSGPVGGKFPHSSVFVYYTGGSDHLVDKDKSQQRHLYGIPWAPVKLIDLDLCDVVLDNPFSKSLKMSWLVDFDMVPQPLTALHPVDSTPYDDELAADTIFPLLVGISTKTQVMHSMSISKIQAVSLINAGRNSFRSFKDVENESVFANRMLESDSNSMFSGDSSAVERAFDMDWKIAMQRKSFKTFLYSLAQRDSSNQGNNGSNAPVVLSRIADTMRKYYREVCILFRFYSSLTVVNPSGTERLLTDLDCIKLESALRFARDADLLSRQHSSSVSVANLRDLTLGIFARGTRESALTRVQRLAVKKCKAISFGRSNGLHRHGFLEFLIRVADSKFYKDEQGSLNRSMINSIEQLMTKNVANLLTREPFMNPDHYRRARMYRLPIDRLLVDAAPILEEIFDLFAGVSKDTKLWGGARSKRMTMLEWFGVLEYLGLYSPHFTFHEAAVIFKASQFDVADIPLDWERHLALSFTGFMEAICRVSEAFFLPSDCFLRNWNCANVVEFYRFVGRLNLWDEVGGKTSTFVNNITSLRSWATNTNEGNISPNSTARTTATGSQKMAVNSRSTQHSTNASSLPHRLTKLLEIVTAHSAKHNEEILEVQFWLGHASKDPGSSWKPEDQFEWHVAAAILRVSKPSELEDQIKALAAFSALPPTNRLRYIDAARAGCTWFRESFKANAELMPDMQAADLLHLLRNDAEAKAQVIEVIGATYARADFDPQLVTPDKAYRAVLDAFAHVMQ